LDESYGSVLQAKARRDRLDRAIAEAAALPLYADTVGRLCCLRGVSTLTALALTVELGDWQRFDPASLGAFLGLVPSEASSGEQRRQGPITKTGNSHARRLLVEAGLAPAPPVASEHRARWAPSRSAGRRPRASGSRRPAAAPPLVGSRAARQAPHARRGRGRA